MIKKGIIAGLIFGTLDILPMFFMNFEDKNAAISYGPILGSGIIGGLILGYIAHRQEKNNLVQMRHAMYLCV